MDFQQLDKYDLFNAPQYVDFNQLVLNDGFGNDNADEFFEYHREEDDFFPAELSSTTFIPQTFTGQPENPVDPKCQTPKSEAEHKVSVEPVKFYTPQASVNTTPLKVKSEENVKPYEIEINYEEVAHLKADAAQAEKIRRIIEMETAEKLKVNEQQQEIEKKYYLTPATVEPQANLQKVEKQTVETEVNIFPLHKLQQQQSEIIAQSKCLDQDATSVPINTHIILPQVHEPCNEIASRPAATNVAAFPMETKKSTEKVQVQMKLTPTVRRARSMSTPKQRKTSDDKASVDGDFGPKTLHDPSNSNHHMKTATLAAIPKKIPSKVTIPKPFKFSETRVRKLHILQPDNDHFKFKAKPVPMKVLQGSVPSGVKPPPKVTQPMDFHFASEDRIRERNMKRSSVPNSVESLEHPPKQKSCISGSRNALGSACSSQEKMSVDGNCPGSASKPRIRPRSLSADRNRATHVQPFSFEERDRELMKKKEEKIRKLIEEQSKPKEFHAQPLPDFSKAQKHMPPKTLLPVTTAKPFALKCDQRGANYKEELHRKLEEEKARLKQMAQFHAHPAAVIHRKPFIPEKSQVPLAEPLYFNMKSDKRAEDRAKYDEKIRQKEEELESLRKQEQMMKEEQERKMTQALRQMRIHKAKPLPKSRIFEVKHSERPLTEPKSPAFAPLPSERRALHMENKENIK